jgi:hypothetical protein
VHWLLKMCTIFETHIDASSAAGASPLPGPARPFAPQLRQPPQLLCFFAAAAAAPVWLLHEQVGIALLECGALQQALPLIKAVLMKFPDSIRARRLQVRRCCCCSGVLLK